MKKEAMFFEDRDNPGDGMFFKTAEPFAPIKPANPANPGGLPLKPKKPETMDVKVKEPQAGTKVPLNPPKTASLSSMIGHPGIGRPGIKVATEMGGDDNVEEGSSAMMGCGGKPKRRMLKKKASDSLEDSLKSLGDRTTKSLGKFKDKAVKGGEDAIDSVGDVSPGTAAAIVAGAGLYGGYKLKKGLGAVARGVAGRAATPPPGLVRRWLARLATRR